MNRMVNQKYKDTVFRMLFSDKENLLSLYNALNQKNYDDPESLEIVTLENAIYMGMKNDLAFILDFNLFLWEHQSTYNPNIPLRNLFYISSEYQKYVKLNHISLYSTKLQKIPAPKFIVFYNGTRKIDDYTEHRLSDAYENFSGNPALELKVAVININEGHNPKLMEQCQTLKEYSQYVAKVRNYKKQLPLEQAVEKAVNECIHQGILANFLIKNRAEVISMSIFEYDQKEEEELLRKAEYNAGFEDGMKAAEEKNKKEKARADQAELEILRLKERLALLEQR